MDTVMKSKMLLVKPLLTLMMIIILLMVVAGCAPVSSGYHVTDDGEFIVYGNLTVTITGKVERVVPQNFPERTKIYFSDDYGPGNVRVKFVRLKGSHDVTEGKVVHIKLRPGDETGLKVKWIREQ